MITVAISVFMDLLLLLLLLRAGGPPSACRIAVRARSLPAVAFP